MLTVTTRKPTESPRRQNNRPPRRSRKAPALKIGVAKPMSRKKHAEHANHERWLVSYADFITLLFAFFVVMFATSQTDKAKAQQVSESVKKALEGKSVSSMVRILMGGTIDTKGAGNAQMRGPGGAKEIPKTAEKKSQEQIVELLPSLQVLTKELEQEIKAGKLPVSIV